MARVLSLFTFLCWVLLKDLINSKHLPIALLNLLQLPQKIPELGLGVNLVRVCMKKSLWVCMKKSLFTFLFLGFLGLISFPVEAAIKKYQFDARNIRVVRKFSQFVF